jgi:hypothetical protein
MDTIAQYVRSVEGRVVGRVFTYDQRLHFVLEADRQTGLARMSCRYDKRTDIIYMPVSEVVMRLEDEMRRQTAAARPKRKA